MTRSLAPRSRIALHDLIACQMGALEAAARAILGRIALNRVILRSRERPGDADLVAPQRRRRICPTSLSMPPDLPSGARVRLRPRMAAAANIGATEFTDRRRNCVVRHFVWLLVSA